MSEYSHLSEPDEELVPYMEALKALPQIYDVAARRAMMAVWVSDLKKSQASALPPDTRYRVADHQVDVAGGTILVRGLTPTSDGAPDQTFPLMFWMHGGGWTMGSIEMEDYKLRSICVELQISILNVEYRLAPEHKHPTPLNDCYTALKWATENATLFSADLSKGFIIAGASAGAHLAAVIAHRVRDDPFFKDRQLTGQILQIPTVVDPSAIPEEHKSSYLSLEQNKDAPGLTKKMVLWGWEQLGGSATDPEVSPLLYPSHKGLAPAFMQVCGMDPLRDEAFLYEKMLNKDGVNTRLRVYPGVPHAFSYRFPALKSAIKWNDEYRTGLEWLLDGAPS